MNMLVVKLSSLGDIVLATPALRAIRERWPEGRITVAVNREFVPVVKACPWVDAVLVREGAARVRRLKTLAQAIWARCAIRVRFDLAIDLQGNFHSAAWTSLTGGRRQCGLGTARRGWEFSIPSDHSMHAVDLCGSVVERLGATIRDRMPRLEVPEADDRAVEAYLRSRGLPVRGYLVVQPWTAWESKEWPIDRYADLLRGVLAQHCFPHSILIMGSANEAPRAVELARNLANPRVVSVAGELPLGGCLALWSRASAFVGGDTGPMHASAALGVPVVALFGPTLPEVTGPVGPAHRVIQASRPSSHDAYRDPAGRKHMLAIQVDEVLAAVRDTIRDRTRRFAA